jgi:hypothetical protein
LDGKYSCQPHVARFTACYKPFEVWKRYEISSSHGSEYEAQNLLRWVIALMMETARTSETLVDIQLRTWQYIPEILSFMKEILHKAKVISFSSSFCFATRLLLVDKSRVFPCQYHSTMVL